MPTDAKYIKDINDILLKHVYVSTALGATLENGAFWDLSTGMQVTPGTFYAAAFTGYSGCKLMTGE
jgi:hypothetical protein